MTPALPLSGTILTLDCDEMAGVMGGVQGGEEESGEEGDPLTWPPSVRTGANLCQKMTDLRGQADEIIKLWSPNYRSHRLQALPRLVDVASL